MEVGGLSILPGKSFYIKQNPSFMRNRSEMAIISALFGPARISPCEKGPRPRMPLNLFPIDMNKRNLYHFG